MQTLDHTTLAQLVFEATRRIKPYINETPVLTSTYLNQLTHTDLYFKCENFQKMGAFKFRGACNAVFSLSKDKASKGVATHSSGNHGQALALAAKIRGVKAYIVMPRNAPTVKVQAVKGYGAEIIFCDPNLKSREAKLAEVLKATGAHFVPPYNDYHIIAGQGTAALELIEKIPKLDIIITPVGGGGLLSGTAIITHELSPDTQIWAGEPSQADDAFRSLQAGKRVLADNPTSIADGLLTSLGPLTFPIIKELVSQIITVSEQEILEALQLIWERMKIIVEPSSAVALAAILKQKDQLTGKRIGLILSGGNVDIKKTAQMIYQ